MNEHSAPILVVGDEQENGELVVDLLANHFRNVHMSCDASQHAADLATLQPAVVVLVFNKLAASRQFQEDARAADAVYRQSACSSIVLCDARDVQAAFELCRQRCFDDYVLFWPMSHDGARLPMAVLQALRTAELRVAAQGAQAALPPTQAEPTGSRRSEPGTVLFVEDDPEQHAILRLMLAGTQLTPVFAGTAARALQMLDELLPGILMVDVHLPDGSGVDLIRHIKADAAFDDVPIVTVTGNRTREVVLGSIAAGAVDFIAKPYTRHMLLAKLGRALGRPLHSVEPVLQMT